jgi:hypothetical protein
MKKKNKLKEFLTEKRNHLTLKGNYDLERKNYQNYKVSY